MRKLVGIVALCAVAVSAIAVPARRGGVVRTAADGTEQTVFLNGDETFHYITDANGNWLDEETLLPMSEERKGERLKAKGQSRMAKARRAKQETGTDRLLAPRGIIILVSFQDKEFQQTNKDMTEWAMGEDYTYNGATGSIHQYFYDQSWGEYDMEIDVVGPVTVSRNVSYYGSNDWNGDDKHPDEMVREACQLAADAGADFSKYDSNNDGYVDWIVVLYAGKGEADGGAATTIWPHQYELSYTGMQIKLNGKTVDHYCCLNEIDGQSGKRCGIGTFCHEFSHVMGLPDFYATNNASHRTMCEWDIMDYGPYLNDGNTPPCYSAYERWFMGWITPRVLTEPENVTLRLLDKYKEALLLCDGDAHNLDGLNPQPKTFYLLESRTKAGWDKYLPGYGMMITKVQYSATKWSQNTVNNTSGNLGIDIIEAKKNTSSYGATTDLFPKGATQWYDFEGHEIEDIKRTLDGTITFLYNGGWPEGIENTPDSEVHVQKVLRDGQVLIIRNNNTYDLNGRLIHENH